MTERQYIHEQAELPELGFTVDSGLERLIRLCWHRGIATFVSCIGDEGYRDGDSFVAFDDPAAAKRWNELTGAEVEWIDDDEIASVAEARFRSATISVIESRLRCASECPTCEWISGQ